MTYKKSAKKSAKKALTKPNQESIENETQSNPPANERPRASNISARNLEKVVIVKIK